MEATGRQGEACQPGRILQLDGLRAAAILAVFFHHAFTIKLLWMGVDLFFVLSGFLITGILIAHKKDSLGRYLGGFYKRRARRIYPPYVLLLAVTTLLFGTSWMRHAYMYVFLMNFLHPLRILEPYTLVILWSLAVEEQFYLVWPFVVYFVREVQLWWIASVLMVVAPLLRWLCTPLFAREWAIHFLTPFRMDCVAAGALLALLWRSHRALVQQFGAYGLGLAAAAVIALGLLSRIRGYSTAANTRAGNTVIYELTMLISVGLILWALSGRWVGILKLARLRYIGRISYSMYLISTTALVVASWMVHSIVATAAIAAAITVVYASVSWYVMEKPLLSREPDEASVLRA
ncbi:acyltransferase family protein [Tunturiibacter gelidoferens]|uniref:Acyltransferase n=1 Tax=Tunturiibacter gelidiferens TaxID=3069689 RepID=A0AAU7YZX3_9BACT